MDGGRQNPLIFGVPKDPPPPEPQVRPSAFLPRSFSRQPFDCAFYPASQRCDVIHPSIAVHTSPPRCSSLRYTMTPDAHSGPQCGCAATAGSPVPAPSLITAPGTGEGSDPTISALLPAAVGSAAPLYGPQLCLITPSSWRVLKRSLSRNLQGFGHPTGKEGHLCFLLLWDQRGRWSKMSVLKSDVIGFLGSNLANWVGGSRVK